MKLILCFLSVLAVAGAFSLCGGEAEYLNAPPLLKERSYRIMNGFISGTHEAALPFYRQYFDGTIEMPKADFLELRGLSPLYLSSRENAEDSLRKVLGAAVPQTKVQLSLILQPPKKTAGWVEKESGSIGVPVRNYGGGRNADGEGDYSRFDSTSRNEFLRNVTDLTAIAKKVSGNRVFAYHYRYPNQNDWYIPINNGFYDYSAPTLDAFREFLKKRYGTLTSLNRAWKSTYREFEEVEAPKPKFDQFNFSAAWQDWQAFRVQDVFAIQQDIIDAARKSDTENTILSWMTSGISTAARDQIVLDDAMRLSRKNPEVLVALTWMEYFDINGEVFGQLANAYKVKVAVEPGKQDAQSYLRTFYNCMRFPVKQINWLFFIAGKPTPQLKWVLNQRALLETVSEAELIQNDTAYMLSYSDLLLRVPTQMWDPAPTNNAMRNLFRLFQLNHIHAALITDYSLDIDLSIYKTILLPEATTLRREMVERLAGFVRQGGTLCLIGKESGARQIDGGELTCPIFRALGVSPENSEAAVGKGRLIRLDFSVASLGEHGVFSENGKVLLERAKLEPLAESSKPGVTLFFKQKGDTLYAGLINTHPGKMECEINSSLFPENAVAADLVNGDKLEIRNHTVKLNFDFQWQIKVLQYQR